MLTFKTRSRPVDLAARSSDGFEAPPESALDVFYHPFAYSLPATA